MNFNKVILMGRLTRDPELRYTSQGAPVTELGLAVNREYSVAGEQERRKETVFVDITFWRRFAEIICQYCKKGDPLFVEGRLQLDTWESQDGQRRSKLRVLGENFKFLSRGGGGEEGFSSGKSRDDTGYEYSGPSGSPQPASTGGWNDSPGGGDADSEPPF